MCCYRCWFTRTSEGKYNIQERKLYSLNLSMRHHQFAGGLDQCTAQCEYLEKGRVGNPARQFSVPGVPILQALLSAPNHTLCRPIATLRQLHRFAFDGGCRKAVSM